MTPDDAPRMYVGERITLHGAAVWFLLAADGRRDLPLWAMRAVWDFKEALGLRKAWIDTALDAQDQEQRCPS